MPLTTNFIFLKLLDVRDRKESSLKKSRRNIPVHQHSASLYGYGYRQLN